MLDRMMMVLQPGDVIPYRTYHEKTDFEPKWLDDETYLKAIEAFVVVDVDVLIVNRARRTLYLAKRNIEPMSSWWVIGGRRNIGEDCRLAAVRHFLADTGIELLSERLGLVALHEYTWSTRAQEPKSGGSHNLAFTFMVELSDEEIARIPGQLNQKEYDITAGLREFSREDLISSGAYPSIIDLYDQIFP